MDMDYDLGGIGLDNNSFDELFFDNGDDNAGEFNDALLASMKSGGQASFNHRFDALAPAIDQAFDLQAVLSLSVGLGWANLSPEQQGRLLDAFRRYTVASYVASFNNYAGQSFSVAPDTERLDADRVVVKSRLVRAGGDSGGR